MRVALERKVRQVQRLCHANLLLEHLACSLAAAGVVALLAALAEKLFVFGVFRLWMLPALLGAAALAATAAWVSRRSGRMDVAILIDERLGLQERFSTALALADSNDPFAALARADSFRAAERANLAGRFRIRLSRRWLYSLSAWVAATAILLLMPVLDVLGHGRQRQQQLDQAQQLQQARAEIKQVAAQLNVLTRDLPTPDLGAELAKVADGKDGLKAEDVKREAIRKLDEAAQRLEQSQTSQRPESMRQLQEMLKGVKGTPQAVSTELGRRIAKGDFKQASDLLKEFQKQMDDGKLSDSQREALDRQLKDLGRQLKELAEKNPSLKEELEKAGLGKDLANLSQEKLKEALQKQGLTQDQIDTLMKKVAASRAACQACNKLGEAMAEAAGASGSSSGMGNATDELDNLDAMKQEMAQAEANLNEIKEAVAKLGKGKGQGEGDEEAEGQGAGEWQEGLALKRGNGSGGPGQGYGARPSDEGGKTGFKPTMVKGQAHDAPAVASYFFHGEQVKGEAKRDLANVVQAAGDAAAEAIEENEIPRKYEGPVKDYFGRLEEEARQPL